MIPGLKPFLSTFGSKWNNLKLKTEIIFALSIAHMFGMFNPKQFSDYLEIPHQKLYRELKDISPYMVEELLLEYMVGFVAKRIEMIANSPSSQSRACITLAVDNSVIDRYGKRLRCTWPWYSGRYKKVVNGQDLLGIVISIEDETYPVHLRFCSKQGRKNTTKHELLISMLKRIKTEFLKKGLDITNYPISLDSWFSSKPLVNDIKELGIERVITAGKSNYIFQHKKEKKKASEWKKSITYKSDSEWGMDVEHYRLRAVSPTFGDVVLLFFKRTRSTTSYVIDYSDRKLRAVEIWRIWKCHHCIEILWKIFKSTLKFKDMRMHDHGHNIGLLIKVIAYFFAMHMKNQKGFTSLSITEIIRKISREYDLRKIVEQHFHNIIPVTCSRYK